MSLVPTGGLNANNSFYPLFGNGVYVGNNPGTNTPAPGFTRGYGGGDPLAVNSGITIQTDTGFISTIGATPQNVLRLTGAGGVGYIQSPNIRFSLPYSGAAGAAILPGSSQMNIANLAFVSTISASPNGVTPGGQINMVQLTSTVKGYGWAQVL